MMLYRVFGGSLGLPELYGKDEPEYGDSVIIWK